MGVMKRKICMYCDKEFTDKGQVCPTCSNKRRQIPAFIKARDDLREILGLKRMGWKRGDDDE